ncbi:MAG TPA: glycosyltransferase family 39 protein [Kofleriaceae bacterium]|nr:glycosyltransferase family 39 protein [Kofleriaceae bacterium]
MSLPLTRRSWMLLGLALAVALVIDFLLYTGFFASDDIAYLGGAQMVAERVHHVGPEELQPVLSTARLGMTVPAGVVYWLTDGSAAAIAWSFILWHLILVVIAFALGRLIHGENTGLVAAALTATSPVLTVYAGALLPDNPTAVWLGLLVLLLELARRRAPESWRAALPWYLAAGFAIGLAYSVKETGIIFAIPAGICVMAAAPRLRDPVWIRNGAMMAAGLGLFMLLEQVAIRLVTGNWVFRLGVVQDFGDALVERMSWQGGANPLSRFWYALDGRLLPIAPITIFVLLAGAIAYPFLLRGRGRNLALQIFFWWPVVYLTVGSTSFTAYLPPSIQARYYALAIVPGAVMTAAVIGELLRRWRAWSRPPAWARGRGAVAALLLALLAVTWHELGVNLPGAGNIYAAERARGFVDTYRRAREKYPQYPIVLGRWYARRMMPLYLRWDEAGEIYAHRFGVRAQPPEPPYLLLESTRHAKESPDAVPADLERTRLEVVYPPASRVEELESGLRLLFGLEPPREVPVKKVGAGLIDLVTRRGDPAAAGSVSVAARLFGREAAIRQLDGGHLASWEASQEPWLAFHELGSMKDAPQHPSSQLARPVRRLRFSVPVRLVAGRKVNLHVSAFGYAGGGQVAKQVGRVSLQGGDAPTQVTVELAAPEPMTSYRLRLSLKAVRRDGALYVGEPRVEVVPDAPPAPAPSGSP